MFSEVDQAEYQTQRAVEKSIMIEREVQKIRENLRGMCSMDSFEKN